jgi:hypothetical protein
MSDVAVVPCDDRVDLEGELAAAQRLARHPRCGPAVDALNLRIDAAPLGVGFIEITDTTYEPSEAGDAALIVAAEARGQLIDLVGCRLGDGPTAIKRGLATVLGDDVSEWLARTSYFHRLRLQSHDELRHRRRLLSKLPE